MKNFAKVSLAAIALGLAACTQAGASGDVDRKQVEAIIQDYLLENPEIIRDAMIALSEKEERIAMEAVKKDIYEDSRDVVIGPDNAKVTIVEFFDYNCGYCKKSTDWLMGAIEKNPKDIRVIFKETPLLDGRSRTSRSAAKAALAAAKQGKYVEMHVALMSERSLTKERIDAIAEKLGLNMALFQTDLGDTEISKLIEDNLTLVQNIPMFGGTPFFMINDDTVSGANTVKLQALLDSALNG